MNSAPHSHHHHHGSARPGHRHPVGVSLSLLRLSGLTRLLVAGLMVIGLWVAVFSVLK